MNEKHIKLPPVLTRDDFETDEEYAYYLDIENNDYEFTPTTPEQREALKLGAQRTIERIAGNRIPVGLRLPKRDVERAKSLALQKGMPYQTLIASVIHQYLDGSLVEK